MLLGTANIVIVPLQLKYRCQSWGCSNTTIRRNCFWPVRGLQSLSWGQLTGGSPAEIRVQGVPSLSIPQRHQPCSELQNNPAKTSQFMTNFHFFFFLKPDMFCAQGSSAVHIQGTEAAAWEREQTEREGGGINMKS